MIYAMTKTELFSEEDINDLMNFLPEERRKKALQYRFFKDRQLSVVAYALMLMILNKEKNIGTNIRLSYNEFGKPQLTDVFFNFSHCEGAVACVTDDSECGIDVQNIDRSFDIMQLNLFTDAEIDAIQSSDDWESEGTRFWTRKEAYCKYLGCGITDTEFIRNCLDNSDSHLVIDSELISECVWLSVCSEAHHEIRLITKSELMNFFQA